jgi:hypothetical protein
LKQQCCDLIDEMHDTYGVVDDHDRLAQLDALTARFPVDHFKLTMLLKSQLLSGNRSAAKKMIREYIPDVRLAWWVQVVLWPVVAVVRIIGFVVSFLRPVGRLGKL